MMKILVGLMVFQSAAGLVAASQTGGAPGAGQWETEAVSVDAAPGKLHGTLVRPSGSGPVPVVLIIAGSGPTDRDGNSAMISGANNSLKLLAEGLAHARIASLRYDKRGIGESRSTMGREADLRFDTYVQDAVEWGRLLRADRRFTTLTVLGHSEGSLIGMLAARSLKADGFVSVAGPGRPAGDTILEQLLPQLPASLQTETQRIVTSLRAGKEAGDVPTELYGLFRSSVQPYMISWLRYDPGVEIARLERPVLVAQGTTDAQVGTGDARLLDKGAASSRLLLVEGMNHVLKLVPNDPQQQRLSYGDPSLPLASELLLGVQEYVRGLQQHAPAKHAGIH